MSHQRAMIKVGNQELEVEVKDIQVNFAPVWTDDQLERMHKSYEAWDAIFSTIGVQMDGVVQAWSAAFKPVTDTIQQLANILSGKPAIIDAVQLVRDLRREHLRTHPSKQTRHFLATIHKKEQVNPVARARKGSVRRMRAYRGN